MPPTSEHTPTGATRYRLTDEILLDSSNNCSLLFSGRREGSRRGAFVGPPFTWGVSAEWSSDGDHRDPSV